MKKKLMTAVLTATMALTMSMTALAGQWTNDSIGWHYDKTGYGNFAANEWLWIDGNGDGIAECYNFDGTSFMRANTTTPDGFTVNENGAWVVNGVVQTKQVGQTAEPEQNNVEAVNLLDLTPSASSSYNKFENKRTIQGDLWSKGFYLHSNNFWSEFYVGGKYTTFTATVGVMQDSTNYKTDMTVEIYGDNDVLLNSYDLDLHSEPAEISVDITGQNYIKIINTHNGSTSGFAMFKNAQFK